MAYRSILGGSPLGIIGVRSSSDPYTGLSSFNIDKTRNIKVTDYNKSNAGTLFTGKRRLRAWADVTTLKPVVETDDKGNPIPGGKEYTDVTGSGVAKGSIFDTPGGKAGLHADSVYDTSILNIIEKLANTKGQLKPADFAYLKHVGVYPNNRLMIARRFGAPTADNIMVKKKPSEIGALATLMMWVPENENFLDLSFGEEWVEAEADFKGVLTSLGEDLGLGNLGGIGGAAGNVVPLPGFTEIFQRAFLEQLGLYEANSGNMIPAGNPNLIKQAKMRKTVGYSEAASGLTCTITIKMTCEYELKYISGIDPTIVWMDLIGTILRFGTSESDTYGLSKSVSAKLIRWANNPNVLLSEVFTSLKNSVQDIVDKVTKQITKIFNEAKSLIDKQEAENAPGAPPADKYAPAKEAKKLAMGVLTSIKNLLGKITSGLIQKYRVKIIGIINSLSGLPSTPWHITIGNPLRPIFCSGDMLTKSVNLKFGPQLAFNDLPSSITVEFSLENARPLGMQEIMAKFNSGYLRSVDVQKTYFETNQVTTNGVSKPEEYGFLPGETINYEEKPGLSSSGTPSNTGGGSVSNAGGSSTTGVGGNNSQENSLVSGNTETNADGSPKIITSSQSENKSYNGGNASNATVKDANAEGPATGPIVGPMLPPVTTTTTTLGPPFITPVTTGPLIT